MKERKYNHKQIEENWRSKWYEDNIYEAIDFSEKPKKYILAELPYPSGAYLHAGHMMRYTVPEVYSRFLRMQGYNVMFPMGWDSFGLPAETFALKTNKTPQQVIAQAEKDFKNAMQLMGYAIDWNREINTCDPEYYKWTQWMFLKMWENGVVEQKEMPVWWCAELGVLADEEVLTDSKGNKVSERGGYAVERKTFKQWNLKITDYADKLLEGLKDTEYMDSVKLGQINWIGKKEGALIDFETTDSSKITVFTTRPDTIYGATFIAISPEHKIVKDLIKNAENKSEMKNYIKTSSELSDMERQTKEKTGIEVKGIKAVNPLNNQEIPIFLADYIMVAFGTGAIMGVPAHDERDFEFAKKYNLNIIYVYTPDEKTNEECYSGEGTAINSSKYNGLHTTEFRKKIIADLEQKGIGKAQTTYKLRDQIWSRQRYWGDPIPLIYTQNGNIEADWELPVKIPEIDPYTVKNRDDFPPLSEFEDWVNTTDSNGNPAKRETDTMPTWAGSNWYFIRYIDPKNSEIFADMEKMKYWLPVDKYFGDAGHTTAHLLYARFWCRFLYEQGLLPTPEPFNWRMSGGMLLGQDNKKMSKSRPEYSVNPQDLLDTYGADAARMVLCFLGPYDETYPWNPRAVTACHKLLANIYRLRTKVSKKESSKFLTQAYHQMVKSVTEMMTDLKMNTAVSEIMKFVNSAKDEKNINENHWEGFLKVVAPFAPFVTEELWQEFKSYKHWKKENSIHLQDWPEFSKELALGNTVNIAIQVNGKVRATLEIERNAKEETVKKLALSNEQISKYVENQNVKKFIYIPNKIVNIVV
ncbi:MAG: leucine--tRNA ligase [Patescibacteria group bacterium]